MRKPNERRFLDSTSLNRAHWLAFGIAIMTFFWGLDGLFLAAIRAAVVPPHTARPAYPVEWLIPAGILGLVGFVLMLFPLLGIGWFKRRVVLDVELGGTQAAGISSPWVSEYIEGLRMGHCEKIVHLRHLLVTNHAKNEDANLVFRLHVEKSSPDALQNDIFPSHVRERLEDIAKFATPGTLTPPPWADECLTGPITIPAQTSVAIQLCFIQLADLPIVGPSGWPDGIPLVVRELISQQEEIVPIRLMSGPTRVRFVGDAAKASRP